ncbi:MAG: cysteine desulfurase NifS [Oscillospiraceae bacterium]|jgi:cysteine desulfurase|nr:cysteine desulfurase NifS [Oscillospiraceae bacterium]
MTVYADNAATTQMSQTALDTIIPLLRETYGNASSIHSTGQEALKILDTARSKVAAALNAEPREIYFTSGGTESDNWAINSAAELGAKQGKKHLISSAIEHHAVLHTLNKLKKNGFEVTLLPVTNEGFVTPESLKAAIRDDTALVTIMQANNEVGTIQPIKELAAIAHERKVPFHTDAVQAVAHIPVDVKALDVDMLSLSGHKFHGPKGVGALYVRKSQKLTPFMEGGAQERSRRAGTENVPGIASMAAALEHSVNNLDANIKAVSALRDKLIAGLPGKLPKVILNGAKDGNLRLPGNVNVCFEGIEGESLLLLLDMAGIRGSSGSACTSGSLDPSHVLLALGLPHGTAHGSLRLSLGEFNTDAEIDYILEQVPPIVERLRAMSPIWEKISKS